MYLGEAEVLVNSGGLDFCSLIKESFLRGPEVVLRVVSCWSHVGHVRIVVWVASPIH